jgi:hypothetical protein
MKTKLSERQVRALIAEALIEELKSRPEKLTEAELQEFLGGLKGGLGAIGKGIAGGIGKAAGAVAGGVEKGYKAAKDAKDTAVTAVRDAAKVGEDVAALEKASKVFAEMYHTATKAFDTLKKRGLTAETPPGANQNFDSLFRQFQSISAVLYDLAEKSAAAKKETTKAPGEREATPPQAAEKIPEARRVYEILERNGLTKKRD